MADNTFSNLIYSQPDICIQLETYAKGGEILLGIIATKLDGEDRIIKGIIGLMVQGMSLYREWLLVHGIKGIEEVENRLKTDKIYIR